MYFYSLGTAKDNVKACAWYLLAASKDEFYLDQFGNIDFSITNSGRKDNYYL